MSYFSYLVIRVMSYRFGDGFREREFKPEEMRLSKESLILIILEIFINVFVTDRSY